MSTTPLTERLLARAHEPLGLIDVSEARARYARIMDWVAARLALVEHLRARYGLSEEAAWGELALAGTLGQTRSENLDSVNEVAATSYDLTHAISSAELTRAAEAEGTTHAPEAFAAAQATTPHAAPQESVRIGRRGAPVFSQLDPATGARAREAGPTNDQRRGETRERRRGDAEPQAAPPQAAPERRELTLARAPELSESAAEANQARKAARQGTPDETAHPASPKEPAGTSAPKVSEASPSGGETAHAPSSRMASPPPLDLPLVAVALPEPRERQSTAQAEAAPEEAVATFARRDVLAGATKRAAEGKRSAIEADATVKAAKTTVAEVADATVKAAKNSAAEVKDSPRARAKEITSAATGHESLTYVTAGHMPLAASRGEGAREPATTSSQQQGSAQTGAQPVKSASAGGVETFSAAGGPTRAVEVNVGRLAEQVSRRLARRLLVERERRGMR